MNPKIIADNCPWSAEDVLTHYQYLGIPHFQRGLVWGSDAVSLLLESLYWGSPCGTFILWRPAEPSREGIALPHADQLRYLILDGQQRIRSIHSALGGDGGLGGEIADEDEHQENGRVWCLNLSRIPDLFAGDKDIREELRDQERYPLFRFIQPPDSPTANFKYNVIPIKLFFDESDDDRFMAAITKLVQAGRRTQQLIDRIMNTNLKTRVQELRTNAVFSVRVLTEDDSKYGLSDVVSLYNRVNSGGKRVESEERAFASLVALVPGTGAWLREVFAEIHPTTAGATNDIQSRDDVLRRRKERNFGFKLIIRTFIQVCAYHFNYSLGSDTLAFEKIDTPRFREDLARYLDRAKELQTHTRNILSFVRKTLNEELHCDDLQMLPDTTALLPAFQLLIRFPDLMNIQKAPAGQTVVGYVILRLLLQQRLNQRKALDLVKIINDCPDANKCIHKLKQELLLETVLKDLPKELKYSNALQDRYTLLLYWLVRRKAARDFCYSQLRPRNRQAMLRVCPSYTEEVLISEQVNPQKQHIVPYSVLEGLYAISARGRVSRHDANNIGNITYISQALNHFETGLGGDLARLQDEPQDNLKSHFLLDPEKASLLCDYRTAAENQHTDKQRKTAFERFCKDRRDLITKGFEAWLREMHEHSVLEQVLKPAPRLHKQDEDHIRALGLPDAIEGALLDCVMTSRLKVVVSEQHGITCQVKERGKRSALLSMLICKNPDRIEVVPNHKPLFQQMRRWMDNAGDCWLNRRDINDNTNYRGNWLLSADKNRFVETAEVIRELEKALRALV